MAKADIQYGKDRWERFQESLETRSESELREMLVEINVREGMGSAVTPVTTFRTKRAVMAELYARARDAAFEDAAIEEDASEWKRRMAKAVAYAAVRRVVACEVAFRLPLVITGKNRAERRAKQAVLLGVVHHTPHELRQAREVPALLRAA